MILIDSCVLIDYTRGKDVKLLSLFGTLNLAVCGIARAEVLAGSRSAADRSKLIAILNSMVQVSIPDSVWGAVGDNLAALRAGGVTVPFPDVVIATVAIANGVELWTRDVQFAHIQRILPALKLFQEPP
jgi:predicted nucleic acid-binding protein